MPRPRTWVTPASFSARSHYVFTNSRDPFGLFPLGKIIELTVQGFKVIMDVEREDHLVNAVKEGEDVIVGSQSAARRVARAAGDGKSPVGPESHTLPGGEEGMTHYHVNGRSTPSHIFYSAAAAMTLSHYAEGSSPLVRGAAAVGDFFNPLSLPKDLIDAYTDVKSMVTRKP